MMRPFGKLSATARSCLMAGVVLGAALVPVAAQAVTYTDGQVAIRSDGVVYLLSGGQRRWVATVQITDDDINAYPEGDPIYTGLAAIGGGGSSGASQTVAKPASGSSSSSSPSSGSSSSGSAATATPTSATSSSGSVPGAAAIETPTGATGNTDPNLPIEVDISGQPKFQAGERIILDIKTKPAANCQLTVKWPDGTSAAQDKKAADSRGKCHYSIEIPSSQPVGTGTLSGSVQDSANHNSTQSVDFDIITKG